MLRARRAAVLALFNQLVLVTFECANTLAHIKPGRASLCINSINIKNNSINSINRNTRYLYASTQCRRVRLSSLSYFAGRSYKYCKGARCVSLRDVDGLALERASRREANDLRGELRRRALVVGLYLSGMRRERSEKN